jgi:hypothetical protein
MFTYSAIVPTLIGVSEEPFPYRTNNSEPSRQLSLNLSCNIIAVLISFISNKPALVILRIGTGFESFWKLDPHYAVRITETLKSLGGVLAKSAQVFQRVG